MRGIKDIQYVEDGILKSMKEEVAKLKKLDPRPHTTHWQIDPKSRSARQGYYRVVLRYGYKDVAELTFSNKAAILAVYRNARKGPLNARRQRTNDRAAGRDELPSRST